MSWWMEWGKDALVAAVALYGAILSTLNWRQAHQKDGRLVRVKQTVLTQVVGGREYAHVEVVNVGHRKVKIIELGIELEGVCRFTLQPDEATAHLATELPATLEDGDRAVRCAAYSDIADFLVRIQRSDECRLVPFAGDSTGGTHRGEGRLFNPREYATAPIAS